MKKQTHIAVQQKYPTRLQEYGVGIFSMCESKSALKKAIKKQRVLVDGQPALTSTYIHGGECIECIFPEQEKQIHKAYVLKLEVVFEEDSLAIVNKPPGVLVNGNGFKTIQNALQQNLNPTQLPDGVEPKTIHRLDFPTTGLLLVGKTATSIVALGQLFAEKKITKQYFAVAIGELPEYGEIHEPVDGKKAWSVFKRVASVSSERFGVLSLVLLEPKTGRRHQLRQHLAFLGCPILGDKEYGKEGLILNGKGLYLHAYSLEFCHPISNEALSVSLAPPEKFAKIFPEFAF